MSTARAHVYSLFSISLIFCSSICSAGSNVSSKVPDFLMNIQQTVQEDISFNKTYIKSGCFVRAHWIANLLQKQGLLPLKIFIQTSAPHEKMQITLPSGETTQWIFHVVVGYEDPNSQIWVLDPILFKKPVHLSDWLNLIHKQNPILSLKIEKTGAETYHVEPLENAEFSRLGDPFSLQSMGFIQDAMEDLFIWQANQEASETNNSPYVSAIKN